MQTSKEPKGKTLLKVTGILLIIFGLFSVLTGALSFYSNYMMSGDSGMAKTTLEALKAQGVVYDAKAVVIAASIALLLGLLEVGTGILGIINCRKREKAGLCFSISVLLIAGILAVAIYNTVTSAFNFFIIIELILPVLYLLGANMNKQDNAVETVAEIVVETTAETVDETTEEN